MRILLATALLAATLLAGCSQGGGHEVEPPKADDGAYVIKATNGLTFSPEHAIVHVGDKVRWVSQGTHDVVANDGTFSSKTSGKALLGDGDTYEFTFTEAGEHSYKCTIHAGMDGVIHVEA